MIIRGDGVAANCCAYLLPMPAFELICNRILLGDQALALIRDIFGRPNLFADLPRNPQARRRSWC